MRGPDLLSDTTAQKTVAVAAAVGPAGPLELSFGADWALQAGSVELLTEPVDLLGPRTRTTVLSWPAVSADFPPEATVGGV